MGLKFNTDLSQAFRASRGQELESSANYESKKRKKREDGVSEYYQKFLEKYEDLENTCDEFGTRDLVYLFREKSREAGHKYMIASYKRDMGLFKKLLDNYPPRDIILMIEFLFSGDQHYLDFPIQPTILVSRWVNKIHQDSIDWANDSYVEYKKSKVKSREWKSDNSNTTSKIGEW